MIALFKLPQKIAGWVVLVPALLLALLSVFFVTVGGLFACFSVALSKLAGEIHD